MKVFLFLLFFTAQASAIDWNLIAINPQCRSGVSCSRDELATQMKEAGIQQKLIQLFSETREKKGKISIAFMSFSQSQLFQALCDETRKGLVLDGFFDSKAGPPEGLAHRLERDCQAPSKANVKMYYMGQIDTENSPPKVWRLHHNKFIVAEQGNQAVLVHASANLSNTGLALNFENWNFMQGQLSEEIIQDHLCNLKAMKLSLQNRQTDEPKIFRSQLEQCLSYRIPNSHSSLNRLLDEKGIISLFSPDPQSRNDKLLIQEINEVPSGSKIQAATYFFIHSGLAKALRDAAKRGVTVQLILDDDLLKDDNSIPGQQKFYESYLDPKVSGFDVKILKTNFEARQLQHNKFLLLYQKNQTRLFTGAGQFTNSAFRNNYENFYFVDRKDIVDQFKALFENIWSRN